MVYSARSIVSSRERLIEPHVDDYLLMTILYGFFFSGHYKEHFGTTYLLNNFVLCGWQRFESIKINVETKISIIGINEIIFLKIY